MQAQITQDIKGELKVTRIYATKGDILPVLLDRKDGSYLVKGKQENFIIFTKNNNFNLIK
jgi:hypothetical protein